MPNPLLNLGSAINDHTGTPLRTAGQLLNRLPNPDSTINAGSGDYTGTTEAKITAAIAAAVVAGAKYVWIPQSMLPYNASLVTFNTGVRMLREGGNPLYWDVLAYGYQLGDQAVGATPAVNAAHAGAAAGSPNGGGIVYFPAGQYWFMTSPTTITGSDIDVTWAGQGRNATSLVMGAAGVTIIGLGTGATRFFLRDLWIGAFSNFATGYGLNATAAGYPSTPVSELFIENVTFENLPNPMYLDNVSQSVFRDLRFKQTRAGATIGDLLYMIRSVSNVFDSTMALTTAGTLPRDAIRIDSDCDTILVWKSELVLLGNGANTVGIHVMDSVGSGTHPPRIIRLSDCQAENGQVGFQVDAARDCTINGFECANNNTYGVYVTGGISVKVCNGQSFLNQQHGIYVNGGSGHLVEGNTSSNNSQQTNATYDGIVIATNDVRIVNNRSGDVFFTLANKQRAGLNLTAGTDFLTIGGNRFEGNLGLGFEQPIVNNSTGANNQILGTGFVVASEAALVAGADYKHLGGHTEIICTLTAARLIGALSTPFKGQRVKFTFIQSGAGAFAVTWNAVYKKTWSDVGNVTGARSSIAFVYDGTNWNQDGAQTPYV